MRNRVKSESQAFFKDWNRTRTDYPREATIPELFEAQAARTPEAVAVIFKDQQLTYGQLNERANQLAHWLIEQGIGPDCLAGLCMHRSLEVIIGMLGILKVNEAYVPMSPGYPMARLSLMMADTRLTDILTQASLVKDLSTRKAKLLLCIGTIWLAFERLRIIDSLARCIFDNRLILEFSEVFRNV